MSFVDGQVFKAEVVAHNPGLSKKQDIQLVVDVKLVAERIDPKKDASGYKPLAPELPTQARLFLGFKNDPALPDDKNPINRTAKDLVSLGYKGTNALVDLLDPDKPAVSLVGNSVLVRFYNGYFGVQRDLSFTPQKPDADQLKAFKRANGKALEDALTKAAAEV